MQTIEQNEKRMTHSELEAAIRDIIKSLYHKEYIAPIHIKDLETGYEVAFEHIQYHPLFISAELPDNEFLKFMREELRHKSFLIAKYFQT